AQKSNISPAVDDLELGRLSSAAQARARAAALHNRTGTGTQKAQRKPKSTKKRFVSGFLVLFVIFIVPFVVRSHFRFAKKRAASRRAPCVAEGRPSHRSTSAYRKSAVRFGHSIHHFGGPTHSTWRSQHSSCGWNGIHEPGASRYTRRALGPQIRSRQTGRFLNGRT